MNVAKPMNVAKWLPSVLLALPLMELVAFMAVSALIGFSWAFGLVLAGSVAGFLILRHVGGNHLERVRVALGNENFPALRTDGSAGPILLAGILLLIPGFITDFLALLLLVPPLRRVAATGSNASAVRRDGDDVIDLAPEQWHKVPDPSLPDPRPDQNPR
jgi:UPF0716 protein FxsA